jgi:hypothetical protein
MLPGGPLVTVGSMRRVLDMPQPWLELALALVLTVGVELELAADGVLDTPAQGIA